jgi:hypothetical protein
MTVIDLSNSMQERVTEWKRVGHDLDTSLLFNCSYYPRGGCQDCTFDSPNLSCTKAHLLIDTRINPPLNLKTKIRSGKREVSLGGLISKLPKEAQEEVRKIIEGR